MKLITKELQKTLEKYPYWSQDEKWWDALVLAKFFTPMSNWTWYVLEWDKEYDNEMWINEPETLYWVVYWFEKEFWSFSISELESINAERDKFFKPCKLSELKN